MDWQFLYWLFKDPNFSFFVDETVFLWSRIVVYLISFYVNAVLKLKTRWEWEDISRLQDYNSLML